MNYKPAWQSSKAGKHIVVKNERTKTSVTYDPVLAKWSNPHIVPPKVRKRVEEKHSRNGHASKVTLDELRKL